MAAPVANRFDQQTQGAMPSYIASQVQRPEGGSPETDTTSDSVDSTSDRGSSEPEADQPDKRLIARKAVISKAKANQHLELRELDVFLKQEKRPVAAKGAGSRGGVEGHYCQVTGCDRARTMIPRHDRALHHVAKHFGLKPSKCAKWSVLDRVKFISLTQRFTALFSHKGFLRGHDKDRHEKSCPGHRRTNSNRSDSSSKIAIMSPMNSVGASCHDHRGSLCPGRCRYLDMSHFCLIHVIKVVGRTLSWLTDHQLAGDSLTRSELCPPAG